ncbi:hypothetical protein GU926_11005 [Nibribacter ruber]|uniref:Tetratricopeptide repeat protein n=1 Tax=Nibribacter ruber TaxID=2698458 RepID=A0A6P1NY27_9BACT|nr:hypothetical protein [Nibribacter ruber]QHL87930.1 hypothetical protein GU926_11005 [Nibribacter ruber]
MAKTLQAAVVAFFMLCSLFPVYAQGPLDELDVYVEKLKSSKATGGSETAFMSIGSDFLYAQEYFEAKNYSSAAYSFMAIVRRQKDHPFANYQLAIALIRQNEPEKAKQAQEYLQQAFSLLPTLKERYSKDVPGASSASTTSSETKEPSNSKEPATRKPAQGLAAYIASLKHSYATGGRETQMLSPGQEAHSGIQYFEAGEFGSAETSFSLSLARDAQNPYVNYLKAVSLEAQGKGASAQPFYQKALQGDASLKNQYAQDVAAAKASWAKLQASKEVKVTPPAKLVYGGTLTYGKYTCHQSIWNGPNASPAYRFDYKGYFELKKDGTYRWLDDGGTGRYAYNAKTGAITWLSGPMKGQSPQSSKFQKGTTVAQITLAFSKNYSWECGCKK